MTVFDLACLVFGFMAGWTLYGFVREWKERRR